MTRVTRANLPIGSFQVVPFAVGTACVLEQLLLNILHTEVVCMELQTIVLRVGGVCLGLLIRLESRNCSDLFYVP